MGTEQSLLLVIVVSCFLGVALLAYAGGNSLRDALQAGIVALRLRRQSLLLRTDRLQADVTPRVPAQRSPAKILPALVWLAAGMFVAALARDPLLSVYALVVGGFLAAISIRQARSRQSADVSKHLEDLVWRFKAIHSTSRSVIDSLEISANRLPDGRLKQAVLDGVARTRLARGDVTDNLKPLRAMGDSHVDQFVFILERIELSDTDTVQSVLTEFYSRLRTRRVLRGRARASMSAINLTRHVLEAGLAVATFLALSVPAMRAYYTGSLANRLLFVVVTLIGLTSSFYLGAEAQRVEETSL